MLICLLEYLDNGTCTFIRRCIPKQQYDQYHYYYYSIIINVLTEQNKCRINISSICNFKNKKNITTIQSVQIS